MKCADCGEEIIQKHPELCPYCGSKNLIAEEDVQSVVAENETLQKTGQYEQASPANIKVGRISTINMECPYCGSSQPLSQKSHEIKCEYCGKNYVVPKKVLDLL